MGAGRERAELDGGQGRQRVGPGDGASAVPPPLAKSHRTPILNYCPRHGTRPQSARCAGAVRPAHDGCNSRRAILLRPFGKKMSEFLLYYHRVEPTTWVYLSSLLMIGLFFKFGRFWSVRNLDLILLILLAPGLLLVQLGRLDGGREAAVAASPDTGLAPVPPSPSAAQAALVHVESRGHVQRWGYLWLFCAGVLLMVRLLVDSMMVRRPLLAPNLSVGGLTFIGCSLFIFLMANVIIQAHDFGRDGRGN